MPSINADELRQLLEVVKERGESIARRKREIEALRRAAWQRMDLLRQDGVLDPPGVAPTPGRTPEREPRDPRGVAIYLAAMLRPPAGHHAAEASPAGAAAAGPAADKELAPAV